MRLLAKKKVILPLVFILVIISLLRLLKLTITFSSSLSSPRHILTTYNYEQTNPIRKEKLTKNEIRFLYDILHKKSPCNILVFGVEKEYLKLQVINKGGTTVFLENNPEKLKKVKEIYNATRVYKVEYKTYAKDAYELLKYARTTPSCDLSSQGIRNIMSGCQLALTGLPKDVLDTKWDVIVVDGPCGDGPESPGRMGSIFMAGVLARGGNGTNVVVHDVDRMIEKWFSWEFLCDENRVSSKGRFWNFRIDRKIRNSSRNFGLGK